MRGGRVVSVGVVVAAGTIAACLSLSPSLSSTEQQVTAINPINFDFKDVEVGSASPEQAFVISPAGSGTSSDTVMSVTGCPGFPVVAKDLPAIVSRICNTGSVSACSPPQTYSFTVSFVPIVAQPASCNVQVVTQDGSGSSAIRGLSVHGNGVRPDHVIVLSQTKIDFGEVRITTFSTPAMFGVTSSGKLPLNLSSVKLNDPDGVFSVMGNMNPHSIPVDVTEPYSVRCKPTLAQSYAGSLDFASDDAKAPLVSVMLGCVGVDSDLDFNPTAVAFPTTRVHEPTGAMVVLHNAGGAQMTLRKIELGSNPKGELSIVSAPPMGEMVQAGASASVPVMLGYSAETEQVTRDVVGTLKVTYDAAPPRTLSITGQALLATVASEPMEVDLAGVCIGSTVKKTIGIYAEHEGTFRVDGASTDPPFSVAPQNQPPGSTGPGGTVQVRLDVSVTPDTVGTLGADVVVQSDAPMMTAYSVPAKAFGLPLGIAATPTQLAFDKVRVDTVSSAQTVTFSNCGTSSIQLLGASIQGAQAGDFTITRPIDAAIDLATAGTHEIDVQMAPRAGGSKQAQLVIEYTGGTTIVPLTGTGLVDRGSYYACSTGRGVELWPIGLAVFALVRRRRCRQPTHAARR